METKGNVDFPVSVVQLQITWIRPECLCPSFNWGTLKITMEIGFKQDQIRVVGDKSCCKYNP